MSMNDPEIERQLASALDGAEVTVQRDGNRIHVTARGTVFSGLSRVRRQQLVYGLLKERIESGEIHAVTMTTEVPDTAG